MNRFKLIITVLISLLAAVIILQNTLPMEITFLFWRATLPAAVWLIIVLLAGFAAGLSAAFFRRAGRKHPAANAVSTAAENQRREDADQSAPGM